MATAASRYDISRFGAEVLRFSPRHADLPVVAGASESGYLHRGFEKSCENHTYNQIIPYTDRLNYCSAIMNNIAFARTVKGSRRW